MLAAATVVQHRHGLALCLEKALAQDLAEGRTQASVLVGWIAGHGGLAPRLEFAPEIAHGLLHQAGLALGIGAHALGDDLAGAREGLDVATLDGEQRLGIECPWRLGRVLGHGFPPDFW